MNLTIWFQSFTDICEYCENETSIKTKIASNLKELNHTATDSFDNEELEKHFQSELHITKDENAKLKINNLLVTLQDYKVWLYLITGINDFHKIYF